MIRLAVRAATREVFQAKQWRRAFEQDGLLGDQAHLSSFVRKQVADLAILPGTPSRPTLATLRACWPRNKQIPLEVWAALPPEAAPGLEALPGGAAALALLPAAVDAPPAAPE